MIDWRAERWLEEQRGVRICDVARFVASLDEEEAGNALRMRANVGANRRAEAWRLGRADYDNQRGRAAQAACRSASG